MANKGTVNNQVNSRFIAASIIASVFKDGVSLTSALEGKLQAVAIEKDRAFIKALCFGVLRYYFRLDFILSKLLQKPFKKKDEDVRALLLSGLYQIAYMRVKEHAAVSETVAALRRKPHYKPLANAVLRNYLRNREDLDGLAARDPVAGGLHPAWMIEQIAQDWPDEAEWIQSQNNLQPPMTLRVDCRKIQREDYLKSLKEAGIPASFDIDCVDAVNLKSPVNVEHLPGFDRGWVSVQDKSAQLAAGLMDLKPGLRVLDVCAAPGGKCIHMLELEPGLDSLLAVDLDPERMRKVEQALHRSRLQAEMRVGDACEPASWFDGNQFDRVLLDVPCSASGVIRRHPDIKLLRKKKDIAALQATQKKIFEAIWPLLKQGGKLLYATCSILKQENEHNVGQFLAEHGDAREMPLALPWGQRRTYGWQLFPGQSGGDGFYYALLEKSQ